MAGLMTGSRKPPPNWVSHSCWTVSNPCGAAPGVVESSKKAPRESSASGTALFIAYLHAWLQRRLVARIFRPDTAVVHVHAVLTFLSFGGKNKRRAVPGEARTNDGKFVQQ
ncbi:hypothetical protein [Streptomyces cellulosae]|uniref:Transposase DDE domain-containing protein n=1 Tax=Streptomyces cellulosae TaxID=1968 RepID=A0ABW7YGK3_STRCE